MRMETLIDALKARMDSAEHLMGSHDDWSSKTEREIERRLTVLETIAEGNRKILWLVLGAVVIELIRLGFQILQK